ncbi:hypothetical protein HYDPIDRAFT_97356 [Hydnomerulius pinastri MD-312]|uniref:SET domain-containing protein n=1 Tax=Hydnomerulius pinastri MD-312 TaxID=994086 RepID=A0A0C9W437_9AGAM|nr:hypothetical protein HYDPIDRAFT_97356 [Hydnomerulius pinastri MD-312]
MTPPGVLPDTISLLPHPTARDKTVANAGLLAGTVIISVPSLANVLLPAEKGRRCDFCLSLASRSEMRLQRCSGCAAYWYCGIECQRSHWRTHGKYCKNINQFCASRSFEQLEAHEKLDALLLTHLLAECSARNPKTEVRPDLTIFMSLLQGPMTGNTPPPTCPLATAQHPNFAVAELFSRCGNNNFSIHSHLTTIAHGVFPLTSRLFNHSCVPNAVTKYTIDQKRQVRMDVVALRDIAGGEEICIPYVDPALVETRQQMFQLTYGFTCTCPSCTAFSRVTLSQPAPDGEEEFTSLCVALRQFVFPDPVFDDPTIELPGAPIDPETVPSTLLPLLRESCLTKLCDVFSASSHDGPFDSALDVGLTVLAFYTIIYPPNYPQIGMHLLEMAKTAWNAIVTSEQTGALTGTAEMRLFKQAQTCLRLSGRILNVVGPEGDAGGPLTEVRILNRLINEQ